MAFNQLLDFIDNLDTSIKHIVMFYEEPEYAKLVQIKFLNDGLKRGECCVYVARDEDDLAITKADMVESGIDVDYHVKKGLLQFYIRKPTIVDNESYKQARTAFQEEIEKTFAILQDGNDSLVTCPKIRGVGSISRDVFTMEQGKTSRNAEALTSQLLVEKLFQSENTASFEGMWMCAYQNDDIFADMDKEWMPELLASHDSVLYLPKLSNGIALDVRKQ
jgi:hypothetical protein